MGQQVINTTPGSADTAPAGAAKINANFAELYAKAGAGYLTYASPSGAGNNVNPGAGWPAAVDGTPCTTLGVTLAAGDANWTGLVAGADGQSVLIVNQDAANTLILNNASGASTAANRFAYAGDLALPPGATALAVYRSVPARWYLR